jgi:hypothetical protein
VRRVPPAYGGGALALVSGLVFAACTRVGANEPPGPRSSPPPAPAAIGRASGARAGVLQSIGGYTSGPLKAGDGWFRRNYVRGGVEIEVTLASQPMTPDEYEAWYEQARLYPPARLPISGDQASGFFTCAVDGGVPPCQLHGQTREGLHIEASGNRAATRVDLEDLLAMLNWK